MRFSAAVVSCAVVVGLAGCGGSSSTRPAGAPGGPSLTTRDFAFDPAGLTVKPGQKVTLTVTNKGQREHNLTIAEAKVNQDLEKGSTKSVTFTAPAAGTYQYFCEYHKASNNMVGTLTVTP